MFRRLLAGFALSAGSLILTLAVLEVAVRRGAFANPQPRTTKLFFKASSPLQEPNFRDSEPALRADDETFRILVVGDSYAWGHGMHPEDSFPNRLQIRLNAVARRNSFEVINWSRPGWNTVLEYRSVAAHLDELSPDLLLLAFVLNDAEPFEPQEVDKLRTELRRREPRKAPSSFLYQHSRLYALVWDRLENTRIHRAYSTYYHSLFAGPDWQRCLDALKSFRDLAHEKSIPMVLLVLPIFDSPMDDSYAYRDLHRKMREVGRSLGLPVLDLMEAYQGFDVYRLAVRPFTDAHPNELAHRIAADFILDFLARARLVPELDYKPQRQRDRWRKSGEKEGEKTNGAP